MASLFPSIVTGVAIGFQTLVAATDGFCGLSGQDSIIRAILVPLDSASGLLLFIALLHYFDYIGEGFFMNLPRWSLLHSLAPGLMQIASNVEFPIRTDWRQVEKPTRIAQIRWKATANEVASDYEIVPNTSLFIVPYMRAQVPPGRPTVLPRHDVTMSRDSIQNAAAQSFARFLIVVTWSSIMFAGHNVILWFYVTRWQIYLPLVFAGYGRLLLTIFQASSVFTYSCHYKGVCTWASPYRSSKSLKPWAWDDARQQAFSQSVRTNLGWNYPAKIFCYILEFLWPRLISSVVPAQQRGTSMYSVFGSPVDVEFATGGCLELRISERTTSTVRDLYDIRFLNVPQSIKHFLRNPLVPSPAERLVFGGLTIVPIFVAIVEPVLVGVIHAHQVPKALYLLEQVIVAVIRYYDFSDSSINTKLRITTPAVQAPQA